MGNGLTILYNNDIVRYNLNFFRKDKNMKKLSIEYVKEEYNKKGYKLLDDIWEGNNKPMNIMTDEGYLALQSYANFQQGKSPVIFGFQNPYAEDNIKMYIQNHFKEDTKIVDIKRIRKKSRNRFLLTLQCANCNNIYTQTFDDIQKKDKSHLLCNDCNKKIRGKKHRKDEKELIQCFQEHGYTLFPNQEILRNARLKVIDSEQYIGYVSYNNIVCRGRKMSPFEIRGNQDNYIYNINNWCRLNGINTKAIRFSNEKPFAEQGILFQCECGEYFETTKNSFFYGKCRCDKCSQRVSRYEYIIQNYLDQCHIKYIYQYSINSCRDVLPLPFDFQLQDFGALIEVDGEGHEKPCHFNHISYEKALKSYTSTIKHDKIKNDYCNKYNIPLLRISYKDIKDNDNYKSLIDNFIKTL